VQTHDASGRTSAWARSTTNITIDLTNPTTPTVSDPPANISTQSYSVTWSGGSDTNLDYYKVRVFRNNDCSTVCAVDTTYNASPYTTA
jgi:hypothetical protein